MTPQKSLSSYTIISSVLSHTERQCPKHKRKQVSDSCSAQSVPRSSPRYLGDTGSSMHEGSIKPIRSKRPLLYRRGRGVSMLGHVQVAQI